MGLVEEIASSFENENDDMDEAANANFDKDRETNPIKSNPKLSNNLTAYISLNSWWILAKFRILNLMTNPKILRRPNPKMKTT